MMGTWELLLLNDNYGNKVHIIDTKIPLAKRDKVHVTLPCFIRDLMLIFYDSLMLLLIWSYDKLTYRSYQLLLNLQGNYDVLILILQTHLHLVLTLGNVREFMKSPFSNTPEWLRKALSNLTQPQSLLSSDWSLDKTSRDPAWSR